MIILGIDTTEATSSVALTNDKRLIGVFTIESVNTHSETLLPMIDSLLSASKIKLSDIDAFACAIGPGSFTGLRIGAATAKGLAMPTERMCIGVSSLDALLANMSAFDGVVCAAINARRSQFYVSVCRFNGGVKTEVVPDSIMLKDELLAYLRQLGDKVCFVGSGADELSRELEGSITAPVLETKENAYSVAACAYDKYMNATADERLTFTADRLNPAYLRKTQAERELEERKGIN